MSKVLVRIATAAGAALIAVALGVQLHAHGLLSSAGKAAGAPAPTAAELDKTLADLRRVSDLRPGTQALLLATGVEFKAKRYAAAVRSAQHATRREPDNFSTWLTLGIARRTAGDQAGARAAFARAHVLNPLYPIPR